MRQLISSLITSKAIPRQLIQIPLEFASLANESDGTKTFSLQPELSDYKPREGRTIFFFMYDTIVYDEKSGHNTVFLQVDVGRIKCTTPGCKNCNVIFKY